MRAWALSRPSWLPRWGVPLGEYGACIALARTRDWLLLNTRLIVLTVVAAVLVAVVVVLPLYAAYQGTHPPRRSCSPTPKSLGLYYFNFTTRTIDGVEIRGWVAAPGNRGPVFILLHPYAGCRSSPQVLALTAELARRGYVVAAFDFRGHGCSGGDHTTLGAEELHDAQAVVDYIYNMYHGERRIYLLGLDMGAAVAVMEAAGDPRVSGVVADAPYCSLRTAAERLLAARTHAPAFMADLALFYARLLGYRVYPRYGPCLLAGLQAPLVVVHEAHDPVLTRDEAARIAGLSPCGRLLEVDAGRAAAAEKLGAKRYLDTVLGALREAEEQCQLR
jgi:alpha/beta superfamily hydrolase